MHFDEDNEYDDAPATGDTLIFDTGQSEIELGPANIDTDGDGLADSLIVVESGEAYLATDLDGDGYVDQVQENPAVGDGSTPRGDNGPGRPEEPEDDGRVVQVDRTADDLMPTAPGSALDDLAEPADPEPQVRTVDDPADPEPTGSTDSLVIENDGEIMDLGEPTFDSDGDGSADTVITELDDGSVITFTDQDGDGDADQIVAIGADGSVEVAAPDGRGGWEPVARGHVTPDGEVELEEL